MTFFYLGSLLGIGLFFGTYFVFRKSRKRDMVSADYMRRQISYIYVGFLLPLVVFLFVMIIILADLGNHYAVMISWSLTDERLGNFLLGIIFVALAGFLVEILMPILHSEKDWKAAGLKASAVIGGIGLLLAIVVLGPQALKNANLASASAGGITFTFHRPSEDPRRISGALADLRRRQPTSPDDTEGENRRLHRAAAAWDMVAPAVEGFRRVPARDGGMIQGTEKESFQDYISFWSFRPPQMSEDSEDPRVVFANLLSIYVSCSMIYVRLVENSGRDMAPLRTLNEEADLLRRRLWEYSIPRNQQAGAVERRNLEDAERQFRAGLGRFVERELLSKNTNALSHALTSSEMISTYDRCLTRIVVSSDGARQLRRSDFFARNINQAIFWPETDVHFHSGQAFYMSLLIPIMHDIAGEHRRAIDGLSRLIDMMQSRRNGRNVVEEDNGSLRSESAPIEPIFIPYWLDVRASMVRAWLAGFGTAPFSEEDLAMHNHAILAVRRFDLRAETGEIRAATRDQPGYRPPRNLQTSMCLQPAAADVEWSQIYVSFLQGYLDLVRRWATNAADLSRQSGLRIHMDDVDLARALVSIPQECYRDPPGGQTFNNHDADVATYRIAFGYMLATALQQRDFLGPLSADRRRELQTEARRALTEGGSVLTRLVPSAEASRLIDVRHWRERDLSRRSDGLSGLDAEWYMFYRRLERSATEWLSQDAQ